jgi:hypothetical protein
MALWNGQADIPSTFQETIRLHSSVVIPTVVLETSRVSRPEKLV